MSKQKYFTIAMTAYVEVMVDHLRFSNECDRFQLLLSKLNSFDKSNPLIGLESTSRFAESLICFLYDLD